VIWQPGCVRVREARLEDVWAVVEVVAEVADGGMLGIEPPVDRQALTERARGLLEEDGAALFVLEEAGRVIGEATARQASRGVLRLAMAIVPEGRRRGGGRMLIERVVKHGRAVGAHKLELEVWVENAPAITLYARSGFEVEGLRRRHYRRSDGRLRSALLMARRLDEDR
jgi:ribosomal protein S18 acetylase RimI-like enzyme